MCPPRTFSLVHSLLPPCPAIESVRSVTPIATKCSSSTTRKGQLTHDDATYVGAVENIQQHGQEGRAHFSIVDAQGFHVAGLSHRRESAANARFIAQAPVMLEVLKRWNGSVDVSEFAAEARTILRAIERESNYGNSGVGDPAVDPAHRAPEIPRRGVRRWWTGAP